MTQEEIVHEPKVTQHRRNHHFHVEGIVVVFIDQITVQTRAGPRRRTRFLFLLLSGPILCFLILLLRLHRRPCAAATCGGSARCACSAWLPLTCLPVRPPRNFGRVVYATPVAVRARVRLLARLVPPVGGRRNCGPLARWPALRCCLVQPSAHGAVAGGGAAGLRRPVLLAPFGGSGRARGMTWIADAFCKYPCKS